MEIGLPPAAAAAIVAHFKPTPEPESQGVSEPEADEPEADEPEPDESEVEQLVPMEEFDEAAVQWWLGTVLALTAAQLVAARFEMAADEYDGPLLAILTAKRLQRLLKGSDAEEAVLPLLAARDAYVATQSARAAAPGEVRVGSLRFDTEDRVDEDRAATPCFYPTPLGFTTVENPDDSDSNWPRGMTARPWFRIKPAGSATAASARSFAAGTARRARPAR